MPHVTAAGVFVFPLDCPPQGGGQGTAGVEEANDTAHYVSATPTSPASHRSGRARGLLGLPPARRLTAGRGLPGCWDIPRREPVKVSADTPLS